MLDDEHNMVELMYIDLVDTVGYTFLIDRLTNKLEPMTERSFLKKGMQIIGYMIGRNTYNNTYL